VAVPGLLPSGKRLQYLSSGLHFIFLLHVFLALMQRKVALLE
jgi:hypothetical protein